MPDRTESKEEKASALARQVSDNLHADIFVYSGILKTPFDEKFRRVVRDNHRRQNVLLFLTTPGGSADCAYRMARCLQQHYADGCISLHVDWICKSAGTLLAVGSDELVMADRGELGPLDVQLGKPDEVAEWSSGLTPVQALAFLQAKSFDLFQDHFLKLRFGSSLQITTRTAAEIAANMTIGLFRPIYEQLDPLRLGETQRETMVAYEYGQRLERKNLKSDALDQLLTDYPSHRFVIDRREARQMFERVRPPSEAENELANELSSRVSRGLQGDEPIIEYLRPAEAQEQIEDTKEKVSAKPAAPEETKHAEPDTGATRSTEEIEGPDRIEAPGTDGAVVPADRGTVTAHDPR